MSVNYAAGLSDYEHKGKCGQKEFYDTGEEFQEKVGILTDWLRESQHCVVLTGAGISTSTGIPDFRGPTGKWPLSAGTECPYTMCKYAHISIQYSDIRSIRVILVSRNKRISVANNTDAVRKLS